MYALAHHWLCSMHWTPCDYIPLSLTSPLYACNACVLVCSSEHFLDELKEFGRSYDLIGCGYKHREEQTQKRVCTLQDEVLLLEAGTLSEMFG